MGVLKSSKFGQIDPVLVKECFAVSKTLNINSKMVALFSWQQQSILGPD